MLDHREVPAPKDLEKIWKKSKHKKIAEQDFKAERLKEVKDDVNDGRRPFSDLQDLTVQLEEM